jgi:hypothetical protein
MISPGAHSGTCSAGAEPSQPIVFGRAFSANTQHSADDSQTASRLERHCRSNLQNQRAEKTERLHDSFGERSPAVPFHSPSKKLASAETRRWPGSRLSQSHDPLLFATVLCGDPLLEEWTCAAAGWTCANFAWLCSAWAASNELRSHWRGCRSRPRSTLRSWLEA